MKAKELLDGLKDKAEKAAEAAGKVKKNLQLLNIYFTLIMLTIFCSYPEQKLELRLPSLELLKQLRRLQRKFSKQKLAIPEFLSEPKSEQVTLLNFLRI